MTRSDGLARRQDAIRRELVADPCRPTTAIAKKVHSAPATVRAVRRELERAGTIPHRRSYRGCPRWRDFVEDYEFMREQGITNADIATRLGVQPASLERRARRHGCWQPDRERVA
ncbi:hypothetical protein P9A14_02570 [Gordonia hongkongensis]|uniref:Uncharacterized protein n=1 Tax=Gordonia hongkongensis TaxID=1701090 RepID=A0AAX3T8H4_9ACTN|nr:hypothetical protein [Gordonia hongkongensis]QIK49640.1 hypothetical protein G8C36_22170 [Gordonia terrae]WFP25428.1 hypothetical protein P9A14_02570 [Gordonia hongkongensis]